ncbi:FlxA-like family protein [Herbaspirillum camelliae]|uniref:FlxA-like family protein n=1 Tax=Herbaspirillum camelliae TaxID=1892903 RepID=UPI00094A0052|nr:FlxA-like family protein [Herbaspirillum camelliae]
MYVDQTRQDAVPQAAGTDTLDHDPAELIAQLSHRILILQQQAQSLARFPANKDGKQQRQLLQQQIRNLYQQLFVLEQQQAQQRRRSDNYLSMALSMAAHAAHHHAHGVALAPSA